MKNSVRIIHLMSISIVFLVSIENTINAEGIDAPGCTYAWKDGCSNQDIHNNDCCTSFGCIIKDNSCQDAPTDASTPETSCPAVPCAQQTAECCKKAFSCTFTDQCQLKDDECTSLSGTVSDTGPGGRSFFNIKYSDGFTGFENDTLPDGIAVGDTVSFDRCTVYTENQSSASAYAKNVQKS